MDTRDELVTKPQLADVNPKEEAIPFHLVSHETAVWLHDTYAGLSHHVYIKDGSTAAVLNILSREGILVSVIHNSQAGTVMIKLPQDPSILTPRISGVREGNGSVAIRLLTSDGESTESEEVRVPVKSIHYPWS